MPSFEDQEIPMTSASKALVACVATVSVALTASCSGGNPGTQPAGGGGDAVVVATCPEPEGLGLVIGAHRNVPVPQLSGIVLCELKSAITNGKPVFVVVADGEPSVRVLSLVPVTGGTTAGRAARIAQDIMTAGQAVSEARPSHPGVDDLAALAVAGDEARSLGIPHATLVLADAGLDDRGALNFTRPGLLAAEPSDLTGQLSRNAEEPDLRGMAVTLSGIGYVAPPQAPLSVSLRANLRNIWSAVVISSGGKVAMVDPHPVSGPSVRTPYLVNPVPVPAQPPVRPGPGSTVVFNAQSAVSFVANSAEFLDPAEARGALTPIGRWLRADPRRRAVIVGTTMNYGSYAGQVRLSLARARAAAAVVRWAGASADQITVRGAGSHFAQYLRPDKSADGSPRPAAAVANRSVRITLAGPRA
jgi:outer membrane protein OmpA-like peptidoglycan-associated protein